MKTFVSKETLLRSIESAAMWSGDGRVSVEKMLEIVDDTNDVVQIQLVEDVKWHKTSVELPSVGYELIGVYMDKNDPFYREYKSVRLLGSWKLGYGNLSIDAPDYWCYAPDWEKVE